MEVLFLYHRLYHTARKQLESLEKLNFGELETLTRDREKITSDLCKNLKRHHEAGTQISKSVRRRIRDLTAKTLDVDSEIKGRLLEELEQRTLELAGLSNSD